MKPVTISASLSPPAASLSAGVTKSAPQLPISRSNNSTWEKPERARTSHACEPCRERKTKCDGERPSCRRCSHTGTSCHYGYGKGWRKRKTAEDLTATSRRLARYEALLAEILPMVSSEVRELIEDARDQDAANSNGSETNETEQGYPLVPSLQSESSTMSSTASRILLPLPVPSPLTSVSSRLSAAQGTFDPVSPPTVVPNTTGPSPATGISSSQTRLSPDALPRLPSITPDGQLIDPTPRDLSPSKLHRLSDAKPEFASERFGISSVSPSSQTLLGVNTKLQQSPG